MKRVLLTGCTGFVGAQIHRQLKDKGYYLRLVIREGTELELKSEVGSDELVLTKDLFSQTTEWWEIVCDGISDVIHCAWYTEPGLYLQSEKNLDCLFGTLNLARGASRAGVSRFIGLGTCFEYAASNEPLKNNSPLNPLSLYAATKVSLYLVLSEYLKVQSINFLWCRLFYLYGDNEDTRRLVPYVREKLSKNEYVDLTSGNQIRDFLDVEEAAKKIINCFEKNIMGVQNICSGIETSVRTMVEKIADEYGRRDLLRFGVRSENLVDPSYVVGSKEEI